MRKHARAWFMKVLLGVIILVFVFYFGSLRGRRQAETIALVDGKVIAYVEYQNEYQKLVDMYRQRFKGSLTDDMLKSFNLKQRAFDNLINQAVILAKADELNLGISEKEVKDSIFAYPAFQRNGTFDIKLYHQMLRYNRISPEDFEFLQQRMLKTEKLEKLITGGIKVSESEIVDFYRILNEKINVEFLKIPVAQFTDSIKPSEEALEAYLAAHEEEFRIPRQIQVAYIAFRGADYAKAVEVSEDDIDDYYFSHKNEFMKDKDNVYPLEEVRNKVRDKIMFIEGMDLAASEAREANDIIYQEENFDEFARTNSLKITTTGMFSTEEIPEEFRGVENFATYVFDMKQGETAPLLQDDNGFYIVKLYAAKDAYIPALPDIRDAVTKNYRAQESAKLSLDKSEELLDRLKKGADFGKLAHEEGLTIEDTGLFVPGPVVPVIGYSTELGNVLFTLTEKDPYPEKPYLINDGYVIVRFKDRGELDTKDLEAQKDKLKKTLLNVKGAEQFRQWLETIKVGMIADGTLEIVKTAADM